MLFVDASANARLDRLTDLVPGVTTTRAIGVCQSQLVAHPVQAVAMIEDFLRVRLGRSPRTNQVTDVVDDSPLAGCQLDPGRRWPLRRATFPDDENPRAEARPLLEGVQR